MHACSNHKSCIKTALQTADAICQNKGLRFTQLRRKVLKMIWANHNPAKAYDILDKLKSEEPSAKPPTVYRTLDFLIENGLIHKLNSLNAYIGCPHPLKHNECYFLICQHCGVVKECCNKKIKQNITEITKNNKFYHNHTVLEIKGKCQNCQENNL